MVVVVTLIGILAAIAVPACLNARENSRAKVCRTHIRHLQDAKERWALDNRKSNSDTPKLPDLIPTYLKDNAICPGGGNYTLGTVGDNPKCSIPGHSLD